MTQKNDSAIQLSHDTVEVNCRGCGDPMILQVGETVHCRVEVDGGEAYPICSRCHKEGTMDTLLDVVNG